MKNAFKTFKIVKLGSAALRCGVRTGAAGREGAQRAPWNQVS